VISRRWRSSAPSKAHAYKDASREALRQALAVNREQGMQNKPQDFTSRPSCDGATRAAAMRVIKRWLTACPYTGSSWIAWMVAGRS
jgi:hypothetical protein